MMIAEEDLRIIRDAQSQAIQAKALVDSQLELIYRNNWFNLWVPKQFGGLEFSLPEGLELLEELAYWDAGLGWTITLCAGANMFAGYLDTGLASEVFKDPKVCFGGSGRASGKAVWDGERFHITGFWRFATGAPHLTHFTLNSFVYDGDEARYNEDGTRVVWSFLVPREMVLIHYDWDSFGLACTASHSFSLENAKIESRNAFQLIPEHRVTDSSLYRIPFLPFAEVTLLANYMGMFRRFLHLVEKHFFDKSQNKEWMDSYGKRYFKQIDVINTSFEGERILVRTLSKSLWDQAENGEIDNELMMRISKQSRRIVKVIREEVVCLFPLVGIIGAQNGNEINTVFKNIFTATQHSLLNIEKD